MNYLDIDFPEDLSLCFSGGPEFLTSISSTKNKFEIRNQIWTYPRYKYSLINKTCGKKIYNQLLNFFLICKGRKMAFNFLDINDCYIKKQKIGIGDGKNLKFKIYKSYSYGDYIVERPIFKVNNVKVFINNEQVSDKDFSIENGVLIFSENSIPPVSSIIKIDAMFYVVVRFDTDSITIARNSGSIEILDLDLIETKI